MGWFLFCFLFFALDCREGNWRELWSDRLTGALWVGGFFGQMGGPRLVMGGES